MLYCPNYNCQALNSESHTFCQKCRTPLPKHYLWSVGEAIERIQPGQLLAERFLCKAERIFLDTKPGLLPTSFTDVPNELLAYLRLSPFRVHVPQVYEVIKPQADLATGVALLEQAAFRRLGSTHATEDADYDHTPQLLPLISDEWAAASALRQLNWLWQWANLWQPLQSEGVAASLLTPNLIRVEGPVLRLLEFSRDRSLSSLPQLAEVWAPLVNQAHPAIAPPLQQLLSQLRQGELHNAEQVAQQLDHLLNVVGMAYPRQIQISTYTDRGPSRQRNEDACFPPSGTVKTIDLPTNSAGHVASALPFVIVCDGIGGHQGGDVASNLAIEAIAQHLQSLDLSQLDPIALTVELEKAACIANDLISDRNDSEQRFERQRMGTTLVLGLVHGHELYIVHIGDSRAYWITPYNCYQVTLDDDVASREARLGYGLYREALQQAGAGSLVQALGMSSSSTLHPTVQRFILDETSLFLLCSDGLSDNDQVETYWGQVVLPLLHGKSDITALTKDLIQIANTRNGHDNATVGLLLVQVGSAPTLPDSLQLQAANSSSARTLAVAPAGDSSKSSPRSFERIEPYTTRDPNKADEATQLVKRSAQPPSILSLLIGIAVLLGIGGALAYLFFPSLRQQVEMSVRPASTPLPTEPTEVPTAQDGLSVLSVGTIVHIDAQSQAALPPLVLTRQPGSLPPQSDVVNGGRSPFVLGLVPPDSILFVEKRQSVERDFWVQLRVCTNPSPVAQPPFTSATRTENTLPSSSNAVEPSSSADTVESGVTATEIAPSPLPLPQLMPGDIGWAKEDEIVLRATPTELNPSRTDQVQCSASSTSAAETSQ